VKKASTFMETLIVVAMTMILTGLVIEAAFRVYDMFVEMDKHTQLQHYEQYSQDKKAMRN
tara:strand:- start:4435 stop:4614 length:180 start_codon:yes stop_codon:yes gene_type:complete